MKAFTASQFTPTEWSSAEDKAKFANHYISFVESGFKDTLFPKWFYKRLSMSFGHIAHYDQIGFYATWFNTPSGRADFLSHALQYPCYGDATCTFSDVEQALQGWITDSGKLEELEALVASEAEKRERAEYQRLSAKYA